MRTYLGKRWNVALQGTGFQQIESRWLSTLYYNFGTSLIKKTYATEINSRPTDVCTIKGYDLLDTSHWKENIFSFDVLH